MRLYQRGFTLIEVLMVIVIMAIMMSLAMSSVSGNLPKWRAQGAANELVGMLQKARAVAVKRNKYTIVTFTGVNSPTACSTGLYSDENNSMTYDAGDLKQYFIDYNTRFPGAYVKSVVDGSPTPANQTSIILQPDGTIRGTTVVMPISIVVSSTGTTATYRVLVERSGIARIK